MQNASVTWSKLLPESHITAASIPCYMSNQIWDEGGHYSSSVFPSLGIPGRFTISHYGPPCYDAALLPDNQVHAYGSESVRQSWKSIWDLRSYLPRGKCHLAVLGWEYTGLASRHAKSEPCIFGRAFIWIWELLRTNDFSDRGWGERALVAWSVDSTWAGYAGHQCCYSNV